MIKREFGGASVAELANRAAAETSPATGTHRAYGGIRGGMLCDAPGLGKTITLISFVLKSGGDVWTRIPEWDSVAYQQRRTRYGWSQLHPEDRRQTLQKELGKLRDLPDGRIFNQPVNGTPAFMEEYLSVIQNPTCFRDIARKVEADKYNTADQLLNDFRNDVQLCFANELRFHTPGNFFSLAATRMAQQWKEQFQELQQWLANMARYPDSAEDRDAKRLKGKLPSCATLIVVPPTLLAHWRSQLTLHVDWNYISAAHKVFIDDGLGPLRPPHTAVGSLDPTDRGAAGAARGRTELPPADVLRKYLFVVTSTRRLTQEAREHAGSLVGADLLPRSSPARGRRVRSLSHRAKAAPLMSRLANPTSLSQRSELLSSLSGEASQSALHKVYWLRLVVDEGHILGQPPKSLISHFIRNVEAKHRWILSGTPTKERSTQTEEESAQTGLDNLSHLLSFLRHEPYGCLGGSKLWRQEVRAPLMAKPPNKAAYNFAARLLSGVMVRTIKRDVSSLPPPRRVLKYLPFSNFEAETYNAITAHIKTNILMTMEEGNGVCNDLSLLHPKNHGNAMQQMTHLRIACSGGGAMSAIIAPHHYADTVDIMRTRFGANADTVRVVEEFMQRVIRNQPSQCSTCASWYPMLLLLPCAHLMCVECFERQCKGLNSISKFSTVVCNAAGCPGYVRFEKHRLELDAQSAASGARRYEWRRVELCKLARVEDMQILQPGIDLQWTEQITENLNDRARRHQEFARIRARREQQHPTPTSQQPPGAQNDSPIDIAEEPQQLSADDGLWTKNSKSRYIAQRVAEVRRQYSDRLQRQSQGRPLPSDSDADPRTPKIIIFSEYRRSLNAVGHDLYRCFGEDAIAEFVGRYRDIAIQKFKYDKIPVWVCPRCGHENDIVEPTCQQTFLKVVPATAQDREIECKATNTVEYFVGRTMILNEILTLRGVGVVRLKKVRTCRTKRKLSTKRFERKVNCFVLLLSRDGSHGLDLSFATHIILLEKIWDTALEDQVIARAFRMGATHSVSVEQLIMRGSIEDFMHNNLVKTQGDDSTVDSDRGPSRKKRNSKGLDKRASVQLQVALRNVHLVPMHKQASASEAAGPGNRVGGSMSANFGEQPPNHHSANDEDMVVPLHELIQEEQSQQRAAESQRLMHSVWDSEQRSAQPDAEPAANSRNVRQVRFADVD